MNMNRLNLALFCLGLSFYAHADTRLVYVIKGNDKLPQQQFAIKGGKVKSWQSASQYTLFDSKTSRTFLVNSQNKTYTELKAQPASKSNLSPDVRAQLQKNFETVKQMLKNMPQEQRQKVEKELVQRFKDQGMEYPSDKYPTLESTLDAGLQQATPIPQVKHQKTGQNREINGYRCEVTDALVNGKKAMSLCLAPVSAVGLSKEDAKSYLLFTQAMQKIGGVQASAAPKALVISTTSYKDGKSFERQLDKVSFDELQAESFEIPEGYSESK